MRALVVDADVVSYSCKKDTRAALYEPHLEDALTSISFVTLADLERWRWLSASLHATKAKQKTGIRLSVEG